MAALSRTRRLLKRFHPEGIPWPGTVVYNAVSGTTIFQRTYDLLAQDIVSQCSHGALLDIGTGPGRLLVKLHRLAPDLRVTGLDVSPSMVERARSNIARAGLSGVLAVQEGDAASLPFGDGSFDVVVSTGSLHHWKDPTAALSEVHRVLRPGGLALLYDLVSDTPGSVLKETAREFGRVRMLILWLHAFEEPFYSCQGLADLAESTPFREGRTRFVGVTCCLTLRREGPARVGSIP